MSEVLARWEMNKVSLADIRNHALETYNSLWNQAKSYNRDVKLYLHWTAGHYGQFWDDYHIQIDQDGSIYVPKDIAFDDVIAGTYRRNTGCINVTLLACCGATSRNLGPEAPTGNQIESLALVVDTLADALDLTIDKKRVMTHGEAADNEDGLWLHEPYGPKTDCTRWDLEFLQISDSPRFNPYDEEHRGGTVLRGKANFYRNFYNKEAYKYFIDGGHRIV
jgi:hypothetical protein